MPTINTEGLLWIALSLGERGGVDELFSNEVNLINGIRNIQDNYKYYRLLRRYHMANKCWYRYPMKNMTEDFGLNI